MNSESGYEMSEKLDKFPKKFPISAPLLLFCWIAFVLIAGFLAYLWVESVADPIGSQSPTDSAEEWERIQTAAKEKKETKQNIIPVMLAVGFTVPLCVSVLFAKPPPRLKAAEYLKKSYGTKYDGMMQEHRANYIELKEQIENLTRLVEELVAKGRKDE